MARLPTNQPRCFVGEGGEYEAFGSVESPKELGQDCIDDPGLSTSSPAIQKQSEAPTFQWQRDLRHHIEAFRAELRVCEACSPSGFLDVGFLHIAGYQRYRTPLLGRESSLIT